MVLVVPRPIHQEYIQEYHNICLGLNELSTDIHNTLQNIALHDLTCRCTQEKLRIYFFEKQNQLWPVGLLKIRIRQKPVLTKPNHIHCTYTLINMHCLLVVFFGGWGGGLNLIIVQSHL